MPGIARGLPEVLIERVADSPAAFFLIGGAGGTVRPGKYRARICSNSGPGLLSRGYWFSSIRSMCEGPGLLVHECFSLSQTHDGRVPHGSLGLLAGAHSRHEQYLTRQER